VLTSAAGTRASRAAAAAAFAEAPAVQPAAGGWWADNPEAPHDVDIPVDDLGDDADDLDVELPDLGDDDEEP
jgi:hypothetical protein